MAVEPRIHHWCAAAPKILQEGELVGEISVPHRRVDHQPTRRWLPHNNYGQVQQVATEP
jgi:hypothetical protein